jgi:hypothetical protein
MFCSTTSLLCLLLAAAQPVAHPLPALTAGSRAVAVDIVAPSTKLEIESSGSSRFEISEGAIVAAYSGGVTSRYRGYELRCETLRLDQATGIAVLSGAMTMTGPEFDLSCERLQLNIEQGYGELWGGIKALLKDSGISIEAGHIHAELIDTEQAISLANLRARVEGNLLLTRAGQQLSTSELEYDAATGEVSAPQPMVATFMVPARPTTVKSRKQQVWLADLGEGVVTIAADSFEGTVNDIGELSAGAIVNFRAALGDSVAFAEHAAFAGADTAHPQLQLVGAPVSILTHRRQDPLSLRAKELAVRFVSSKTGVATIAGDVRIAGRGLATTADELSIQFDEAGHIGLTVPQTLVARGDFRRLLGLEELDLEELTGNLR